ncbi:hypothetical protein BaRGS_00024117, partial [Batillaria attramentaria]
MCRYSVLRRAAISGDAPVSAGAYERIIYFLSVLVDCSHVSRTESIGPAKIQLNDPLTEAATFVRLPQHMMIS